MGRSNKFVARKSGGVKPTTALSSSYSKPAIKRKEGVYVIQNSFTGNKYVGKSSNIPKRIEQHNNGRGANWTNSKTGNWTLVQTYPGNTHKVENAITKGVIKNEGFANVRGGSYCKVHYPTKEFRAIKLAHGFKNYGNSTHRKK